MRMIRFLLLSCLVVAPQLKAWYPDYSVMVTDFELPYSFLAPSRFSSIGLIGLGEQFRGLYVDPTENLFQNPAHLTAGPRKYFYLDIASEDVQRQERSPGMPPIIGYGSAYTDYWMPAYLPYNYTREPAETEPIIRALYYAQPVRWLPIKVGGSYEYYYDQAKFYQPYWYWGPWLYADAMAETYAGEAADPYNDYREVERGDNVQQEEGHRFNGFAAFEPLPFLSLGVRYSRFIQDASGKYTDFDKFDESNWADEYLSLRDDRRDRDQQYRLNDLQVGGLLSVGPNRLGISLGLTDGFITREYTEVDSNHYYSLYIRPDTTHNSVYRNRGGGLSEKRWNYDGGTRYGELNWWRTTEKATFRLSAYGEQRSADLLESESTRRQYSSFSRWYYDYYDEIYLYNHSSGSTLERTGTGGYDYDRWRVAVGGEWQLSSAIRFIGGVAMDQRNSALEAHEPFEGHRWSEYNRWWNDHTFEGWHDDIKEFRWYRKESYRTVAIPTGVIFSVGDIFEGRIGLTKQILKTDISSGYDLLVILDRDVRIRDGVTTIQEDSLFVEGHTFPGVHDFTDAYQFHSAITLKKGDQMRITLALQEGILEPERYKLGVEFRW